jgi:validoxylamine A glucosyltransferase
MDLSVVIPTHNAAGLLRRTLASLARQDLPASRYEIIVVDDGSADDTRAVAAEFGARYTYLERTDFCVSRVRNTGARLASADLLVFLDSGVVAGPGLLSAHLAAHAGGGPRAITGYTFGTQRLRPQRELAELLDTLPPEDVAARIGDGPRGLDLRHRDFHEHDFDLSGLAAPWILFWTMNCSVRAADLWAVGGFDEDFTGWGYEYLELGYRLMHHGVRLEASREAWGIEWPVSEHLIASMHGSRRNFLRFLHKHRNPDVEVYGSRQTRSPVRDFHRDWALLLSWAAEAPADVAETLTGLGRVGAGTVVLGCGERVPPDWPPCVLFDFDADLLAKATAGTAHTPVHAVGLLTCLPTDSAGLVVITDRLRGVWAEFGKRLRAEAARVGRNVTITFEAPG